MSRSPPTCEFSSGANFFSFQVLSLQVKRGLSSARAAAKPWYFMVSAGCFIKHESADITSWFMDVHGKTRWLIMVNETSYRYQSVTPRIQWSIVITVTLESHGNDAITLSWQWIWLWMMPLAMMPLIGWNHEDYPTDNLKASTVCRLGPTSCQIPTLA